MITFEFQGKTHEIEVTWGTAAKIADRVGDPHRILAAGGEVGLIQAVRIVSIATGIPEMDLGDYAMRKGARGVYTAAGEILLATIPDTADAPDTDEAKKT